MPEPYLPPYLSVVIPAYNEAQRLPNTLERIWSYLQAQIFPGEIVVVDDGSQDATLQIAKEFAEGRRVRALSPGHQGKGGAVRAGMLAAEGEFLLMTDADLCTPLEDASTLLSVAQEGYDVVIGSRALRDSILEVRQPFYREWMGRGGNRIIQTVLLPGIRDTQCGFKLFRKAAAREIFSRSVMNRWSFDIEALYLARRLGYSICEAPIHWSHRSGSKLRIGRDYYGTLKDLFIIRDLHKEVEPIPSSVSPKKPQAPRR